MVISIHIKYCQPAEFSSFLNHHLIVTVTIIRTISWGEKCSFENIALISIDLNAGKCSPLEYEIYCTETLWINHNPPRINQKTRLSTSVELIKKTRINKKPELIKSPFGDKQDPWFITWVFIDFNFENSPVYFVLYGSPVFWSSDGPDAVFHGLVCLDSHGGFLPLVRHSIPVTIDLYPAHQPHTTSLEIKTGMISETALQWRLIQH